MITSIILRNIRKTYRWSNFTLHIDNLQFANSNIHVIVGPNGSGKTTLLNLIAFLDRPDEGNILFNERDVLFKSNPPNRLRQRIGFVMQNPHLFNMNVFENVALGLKIRKRSRDEIVSRVENILRRLKIEYLAEQSVKHLSRGEYQKVAIAQVLVLEPEVILMDELAANIDRESTLSIEEMVKNIQKKFNTIIVVTTHSLTQARRITPSIISVNAGRIIGSGYEDLFLGEIRNSQTTINPLEVM